ncbi:MAG: chemotaxis protein CheC [Acidimicrobiales bacterium]
MTETDMTGEVYGELTNIGASHAATAMSELLHTTVRLDPPVAKRLTLSDVEADLEMDEKEVILVLIALVGDLQGHVCLMISDMDAYADLLGVGVADLDETMAEIGNIVSARFISALSQSTGLHGDITPPAVGHAPKSAVLSSVIALAAGEEPFFVMSSAMRLEGVEPASVLFLPSAETRDAILDIFGM